MDVMRQMMAMETKKKKLVFLIQGLLWAAVFLTLGSIFFYQLSIAKEISDYLCGDFLELRSWKYAGKILIAAEGCENEDTYGYDWYWVALYPKRWSDPDEAE